MKIIVGLGNPGGRYAQTRHNAGFWVVNHLMRRWNIQPNYEKFQATIAEGHWGGEKIFLVKPQTYMNLSGRAVEKIMNYWKVALHDLLVVFDDLDLPEAQIRLRSKGSSGGHKGVASIIEMLATADFARLKIGIGPLPDQMCAADFVLHKLSAAEMNKFAQAVQTGADAIEAWVHSGIDHAMNLYNCTKNESG